jgi:hypothetical protein
VAPLAAARPRAVALGVALTLSWAILHRGVEDPLQIGDVSLYQLYGEHLADGLLPYRDFALEYPPGALPYFWLPRLASDYLHGIELLAWACGAGTVALVALTLARVTESPRRLYAGVAFAAVGPLALGSVTLVRYDLWPALLTAGALLALVAGRPRLGLGLLAVGAAVKVYPLVLLPIALVHVRREWGMRKAGIALGAFAIVLALVVGPFLVFAGHGLVDTFSRQAGRDLQVESLGAGALLLLHQLGAYTPQATNSLSSFSLGGSVADAVATASTILQGLAVLAVWIVYARRDVPDDEPRRLLLASAAAVAAFVTFGKVLSPQYLLWLIPLVALVAGRTGIAAAALLGVSLLATRELFPGHYGDVVAFRPLSLLVTVRDALLVALYGVLIGALRRAPPHANIRSSWWSASSTPASSS